MLREHMPEFRQSNLTIDSRSPIRIFIAYARKDERSLKKLCSQLEILGRRGDIDVFYDRKVDAGVAWEREIVFELQRADIIVLLGSHHFMNSNHCMREMSIAMRRHRAGRVRVVPVLVRPFPNWNDTVFGKFNLLPAHGRALSEYRKTERDAAYYRVVSGIADAVRSLRAEHATAAALQAQQAPQSTPDELSRVLRADLSSERRHAWATARAVSALSTREPSILAAERATLSGMCGDEEVGDDELQIVRLCALLGALELALLGEITLASQSIVLIQVFEVDELELWRHEVRLEVASHLGAEALGQAVAQIKVWFDAAPDSDIRRACYHRAKGRLAYRVGAFEEAVGHLERAFCDSLCHCDTILGWLQLASAWLEVGELAQARCAARQAYAHARKGLPLFQLRVRWLLRVIAVRGCENLVPNADGIVECAEKVGVPSYCGAVLFIEAVIAWRCGLVDEALSYACRAATILEQARMLRLQTLAQSLAMACGEHVSSWEFARRVKATVVCEVGEVGLQALALLVLSPEHGLSVRPDLLDAMNLEGAIARIVRTIPANRWGRCLDVMSLDEACSRLRVDRGSRSANVARVLVEESSYEA